MYSLLRYSRNRSRRNPAGLQLLVICALILGSAALVAQPIDRAIDWRLVLDWLPVDTQTLVVATQPFAIPSVDREDDSDASPVDAMRLFAMGSLPQFPLLYGRLVGRTASFAVSGVRKFLDFSGIGLGPNDGVAVVVFSQQLGFSLESVLSGQLKERISDSTVFVLTTLREGSLKRAPESIHLFVTQLNSAVLIAATDRDTMRSLLDRRSQPQSGRALPAGLPEWKAVENTAAAWGMRHTVDNTGIVYNAQPVGKEQRVYCFSKSRRIAESERRYWNWKDEGLGKPIIRQTANGVTQVLVPTPVLGSTGSFILLLLTKLGYLIAM